MTKKANMTILLLTISALLLTLAIVFVGQTDQAVAGNAEGRAGDFVAVPMAINKNTEVLLMIDNSVERMNVYGIDKNDSLTYAQALSVNLGAYFEPARQPAVPPPGPPLGRPAR